MELSELTAYAAERYQMEEYHKWAEFPGFSVLCHPQTGKWVALLMRQWDSQTGMELQRCDLKCGGDCLGRFPRPYLSPPLRMRGNGWLGIRFDEATERELVLSLLDRAVALGAAHGFTLVLGNRAPADRSPYQETPLPFADSGYQPPRSQLPDKLRALRRMFDYGIQTPEARAKAFYRQAMFMQDYEDEFPWTGEFSRPYPCYQDLNSQQLRGYFTWRSRLRRGDYQPIPASAAYLYLYELLNGVGAARPEERIQGLLDFERNFLDSGLCDPAMRSNLRRWALELAVLHNLPQELAQKAADPELMERDRALSALRSPKTHSDEPLFSALCCFGGAKLERSPVLTGDPARGKALFAQCWREACARPYGGEALFTLCFGSRKTRRWYPLSNAVYYAQGPQTSREYRLNSCRSYRCSLGLWEMDAYEKLSFDRARFQGFLHEADARLRRYLKTGRYLREQPADAWAIPALEAVIAADRQAAADAARPKLILDLSGLARIRAEAQETRDSLLLDTEPEAEAPDEGAATGAKPPRETAEPGFPAAPAETPVPAAAPEQPSEELEVQLLRALLEGRDPAPLLRARHLSPAMAADAVNERFLEEIGDTVLLCEGEALALVEDYIEEIRQSLGGYNHG